MHPLIATQVRKTIGRLNTAGFPELKEEFSNLVDMGGSPSLFRLGSWTLGPIVYRRGNSLVSPQLPFLAFYCLVAAIRGSLLSVNFQAASVACRDKGLLGPSIALSYTAAYHALTSYLSLQGRAIIDSPNVPFDDSSPHHVAGPVVAVLTRKNQWVLEGLARTHRARWRQLYSIYCSTPELIPGCFRDLFDFTYRDRFRTGATVLDIINDPASHRLTFDERAQEFFEGIADVRHRALYQSLGAEPGAVDALVNRDAFSAEILSFQTTAFSEFSSGLLATCLADLHEIAQSTELKPAVQRNLFLSREIPYFDDPLPDQLPDRQVRDYLDLIMKWSGPCDLP